MAKIFAFRRGRSGEDKYEDALSKQHNDSRCYDCGSTIKGHHTPLCEFADEHDKRDLPQKPGTQHWTGEPPK